MSTARPKRTSLWPIIGGLIVFLCALNWIGTALNPPAPGPAPAPPAAPSLPQMTVAEQTYVNAVTAQSTELGPLFTQISTELKAADMLSAAWTMRMGAAVAGVRRVCDKAQKLTAPASLRAVDTPYQSAIVHFRRSMDLMTQGIDGRSAAILTQGNTEMAAGNSDITQAATALRTFAAAHQ